MAPDSMNEEMLAEIIDFSHDGLGIAKVHGKTVFIEGGIPTEIVNFRYLKKKSKYDLGRTTKIIRSSSTRTEPLCQYYQTCGGCAFQHVTATDQIQVKQKLLLKQLKHFGLVTPEIVLAPLQGAPYQYRRRARLGVHYNVKSQKIELGYKVKSSHIIAPILNCEVLTPKLSQLIPPLQALIERLVANRSITELIISMGDNDIAVVIQHVKTFQAEDQNLLEDFAREKDLFLYLQLKNDHSEQGHYPADLLWGPRQSEHLSYSLPKFDLKLLFHPLDFIQVNSEMNQAMISHVMVLLNPTSDDLVLDLYCGLGNFSLPLAKKAGHVIAIEGSSTLVEKGYENAKLNGIQNIDFFNSNLNKPIMNQIWAQKKYDKILLDPPRAGALELMKTIPNFEAKSIVYVSCDPATLARDIGILTKKGYKLTSVGILDMFPQTAHIESIAYLQLS